MVVYCDSAIVIYWLDVTAAFHVKATARLTTLVAAGDSIAFSDMVRLECRVGPMKTNDAALLAVYDRFFSRPDLVLLPLTTAVCNRATRLCADHNFKAPDAIHLAAAIEGGCDLFLTNDAQLLRCTDIPVKLLP